MKIENKVKIAGFHYEPLHDGTVRYLEELGLWADEFESRRIYNIELRDLWIESYQVTMAMADDRGIKVDPDNEEWQELGENYKKQHRLPLLVYYQGPGEEQPLYSSYYDKWNRVKP